MSKTDLANKIIQSISNSIGSDGSKYSASTPLSANTAIANAITEYIVANTKVSSTYVGTIPGTPPTPDPITSDSHSVIGSCPPPSGNDIRTWLSSLASGISSGFTVAPGQLGITFACVPFCGQMNIESIANGMLDAAKSDNPQASCWEVIADGVLQMVNSSLPVTPLPATNSVSGSAGNVTLIKVSIS